MFYMTIKRDGRFNEVYRSWNMGTDGWERIADGVQFMTEGPTIAKLNGRYYMYTDRIDQPRHNVVAVADWPGGPWHHIGPIQTWGKPNRHGTVVRVTDPVAKARLYTAYTGRPAPGNAAMGNHPIIDQINAFMLQVKNFLHLPRVPNGRCNGLANCQIIWV